MFTKKKRNVENLNTKKKSEADKEDLSKENVTGTNITENSIFSETENSTNLVKEISESTKKPSKKTKLRNCKDSYYICSSDFNKTKKVFEDKNSFAFYNFNYALLDELDQLRKSLVSLFNLKDDIYRRGICVSLYDTSSNCNLSQEYKGLVDEILLSQKVVPTLHETEDYILFASNVLEKLDKYLDDAKDWESTTNDNLRLEVSSRNATYVSNPKFLGFELDYHLCKIYLKHFEALDSIITSFMIDENYDALINLKSDIQSKIVDLKSQYNNYLLQIKESYTESPITDSTNLERKESNKFIEGTEDYNIRSDIFTPSSNIVFERNMTDKNDTLDEFLPKLNCGENVNLTASTSTNYLLIGSIFGVVGIFFLIFFLLYCSKIKKQRSRKKKTRTAEEENALRSNI